MRTLTGFTAVFTALVSLSCSSVRPVAIASGDQCFRCRRAILDTRLAGEILDSNGFVTRFRTAGCMAKYLADHQNEAAEDTGRMFGADYPSGKLVAADRLTFVSIIVDTNTNERDYRGYLIPANAEAAARELGSTPIDWKTVLQKAKS